MKKISKTVLNYILITALIQFIINLDKSNLLYSQSSKDTSYNALANSKIINMVKPGKSPTVTICLDFNYHIGHMDLAANDNTMFRKNDFIAGRNFGTRYGYGVSLIGKFSLHKTGNVRLNAGGSFNQFLSNFVISESPEGKVHYNVWGATLGIENNFNPDKKIKPYIGLDFVASFISGEATFITDTTNFTVKIKTSPRYGFAFNLGFEYAFSNDFGLNLGYKITYANIFGKASKYSANPNEAYLNDEKLLTGVEIPFAGWRQFLYSSFYAGVNFYIGMKNRK